MNNNNEPQPLLLIGTFLLLLLATFFLPTNPLPLRRQREAGRYASKYLSSCSPPSLI